MFNKRRDDGLRAAMEAAETPITSPPRGELAADFRFVHPAVAAIDNVIRALRPLSPAMREMTVDYVVRLLKEEEGADDADA